ncbi:hypothetical protein QBC35DRAFT_112098 [Podospora australis]|uniref:Uncharacterized protein n=1 Tax=Podospora australis TaxID=1536484 RepID=A0AAN7AIP6_9PEZI|nr:hypothetical protein QBC35DRAFT_112098 [Podospora australis]
MICHMCGGRVTPQSYCPSCGHPMCERCRKDDGANMARAQISEEADVDGVSVALATTGTGSPTPNTLAPDEENSIGDNMKGAGSGQRGEENEGSNSPPRSREGKKVLPLGGIANSGKRLSLKTNPFVIADQIAKSKSSEPQVFASATKVHVHAAPPSTPPKHNLTRLDHSSPALQVRHEDSGRHHNRKSEPTPASLSHSFTSLPSTSRKGSSSSVSSVATRGSHASGPSEREHQPDRATEPSPLSQIFDDAPKPKGTPPVLRRVKVFAQRPSSDIPHQVLQVDVEGPDQNSGNPASRQVPRVRVTSPPAWLKNPSAGPAQPGSVAGRLKKIDGAKSSPQLTQKLTSTDDRGTETSTATVTITRAPIAPPERESEATRTARSSATRPPAATSQDSPTAQPVPFWKAAPNKDLATEYRRSIAAITRERQMVGVSKSTSEVTNDGSTTASVGGHGIVMVEGDEDDVGIQGLTIVLHLRGRDDLVISTDLTRESGSGRSGTGGTGGSPSVGGGPSEKPS